jgi:hypothetical protein
MQLLPLVLRNGLLYDIGQVLLAIKSLNDTMFQRNNFLVVSTWIII